MIRFVYPNVRIINGKYQFDGCVRLEVADQVPENKGSQFNKNAVGGGKAAFEKLRTDLARDSFDSPYEIHPRLDECMTTPGYGSSNELAFLLAHINRSKPILFDRDATNIDIWCTGSIDMSPDGTPILGTVHRDQFIAKLVGFADDSNQDALFIVPIENMVDSRKQFEDMKNIHPMRMIQLDNLKYMPAQELFSVKTILPVHGRDLVKLTKLIFSYYADILKDLKQKADKITGATLRKLKGGITRPYPSDLFTAPAGWAEFFKDFCSDGRPGLILTAPSGTGKTCLSCSIADKDSDISKFHDSFNPNRTILFWNYINAPENLVEEVLDLIQAEDWKETKDFFRNGQENNEQFFFIIDGINQHKNDNELFGSVCEFIQNMKKEGLGEFVKIIMTVRSDSVHKYYHHIREFDSFFPVKKHSSIRGKDPKDNCIVDLTALSSVEQAELIYSKYRYECNMNAPEYNDLPDNVKKILQLPLMARFMFETITDESTFSPLTEDMLLESYVSHHCRACSAKSGETSETTVRYMIKSIAEYQYDYPDKSLSYGHVISSVEKISKSAAFEFSKIFENLCKDGFLRKNDKNKFEFSHERILEYVLFKDIFEYRIEHEADTFFEQIRSKPDHAWIVTPFNKCIRQILSQTANGKTEEIIQAICFNAGDVGVSAIAHILGEFLVSQQEEYKPHLDVMNRTIDESDIEKVNKIFEILRRYYFDVIPVPESEYVESVKSEKSKAGYSVWKSYYDRCKKNNKDPLQFADSAMWYADALYNRADNYKKARDVLKETEKILHRLSRDQALRGRRHGRPAVDEKILDWLSRDQIENKIYEIKYQMATIYSDYGDYKRAKDLQESCRKFYEARKDDSKAYLAGYAKALFLNYMLTGDGLGKFQDSIGDLDEAGVLFKEMDDKKSYGRYLVNKAVATLFTNKNLNILNDDCAQSMAIKICDAAILYCDDESRDLQAKAYAFLIKASVHIQRAYYAREAREDQIKEQSLNEANEALGNAKQIFDKTKERYVQHLIYANETMLFDLQNEPEKAKKKLADIIKLVKSDTGDFFNEVDASMDLAYMEADNKNVDKKIKEIEKFIQASKKNSYAQGALRGNWYIWKLSRDYKNTASDEHRMKAKNIAQDLKWGDDYRQAIYTPWYAGIHI